MSLLHLSLCPSVVPRFYNQIIILVSFDVFSVFTNMSWTIDLTIDVTRCRLQSDPSPQSRTDLCAYIYINLLKFCLSIYIVLRTFHGGVYQQTYPHYEQFPEFIEHEVKLFWICFRNYLNVFYSGTEGWSTGWFNKPWFHDSSYPSSVIYFAGPGMF